MKPPAKPDDWTIIKGIGPVISKRLNEAGVYTYEQLASLTLDEFEEALGDLLQRFINEWAILRQARELAMKKMQGQWWPVWARQSMLRLWLVQVDCRCNSDSYPDPIPFEGSDCNGNRFGSGDDCDSYTAESNFYDGYSNCHIQGTSYTNFHCCSCSYCYGASRSHLGSARANTGISYFECKCLFRLTKSYSDWR